ncbi:hypothetical protein CFOL_v3_02173, partial [Cephalotus follicularis]
ASSKISASMDKIPFLPSFAPSNFKKPPSSFFAFSLRRFAISTSLETMTEAGCLEANLDSLFRELSSNSPDRSNPAERDMISKAFKFESWTNSCSASILLVLQGPEASVSGESPSLSSVSVIFCLDFNLFLNQELSFILAMEILVFGFGSNIFDSSLRTSEGNQLGHLNSALPILRYNSIKLES